MNVSYLLYSAFCALAVVFGYSRKINSEIQLLRKCHKELDAKVMGHIRQLERDLDKINGRIK